MSREANAVREAHARQAAKHNDPPCECGTCGPVRGAAPDSPRQAAEWDYLFETERSTT